MATPLTDLVTSIVRKDCARLKRNLTLKKLSIEERFENTGFIYFEGGRVFWVYDPVTTALELRESWGTPTETQVRGIEYVLAIYLTLPKKGKTS